MTNVVIFGCGDATARLLDCLDSKNRVIAFLDNDELLHNRRLFGLAKIYPPVKILELSYDKIIVASNMSASVRNDILSQLVNLGVDISKIEFYPNNFGVDYHPRMLYFKNFAKFSHEKNFVGNVAECGVWTGETAKYLNRYFHDRKIYLFDTFDGYPEDSIDEDRCLFDFDEGKLKRALNEQAATVETVIKKMTFPENVIIKKGFFPESAKDVEDKFCLVHIDFTLYQPTLDALRFFYNSICDGGLILIRDYFAPKFPGIKKAVEDFENEIKRVIPKCPMGDTTCVSLIKGV